MCVPDAVTEKQKLSLRWAIYLEYHDNPLAGHRGVGATASALRRRFYWPGIVRVYHEGVDYDKQDHSGRIELRLIAPAGRLTEMPTVVDWSLLCSHLLYLLSPFLCSCCLIIEQRVRRRVQPHSGRLERGEVKAELRGFGFRR